MIDSYGAINNQQLGVLSSAAIPSGSRRHYDSTDDVGLIEHVAACGGPLASRASNSNTAAVGSACGHPASERFIVASELAFVPPK